MSTHPDEIEEGEISESESEIEEGEISESQSEIEEGSIIDPGDDEDLDVAELLGSLFATEDGDTVCTALMGISNQMQVQNRILVKILAQLQSSKN
tara:strand:+ start:95 stop:379 length:285 start_codon:yes stop_codon:yes gene_type:complete